MHSTNEDEVNSSKIQCVFCDIIAGKLPAYVIYQDEKIICFLPKDPELFGHTLIVPKKHSHNIFDTESNVHMLLLDAVKIVISLYSKTIGATGYNLLNASGEDAQQSIAHFHYHLFPRFKNDQLNTWPKLPVYICDVEKMYQALMDKKK